MAIRFRSRQVIWMLGSIPNCNNCTPAEIEDMRTTAVWQSVMFTASTLPLRCWALPLMASPSALAGGPSSPVTAKCPARRMVSRRLPATYLFLSVIVPLSGPPPETAGLAPSRLVCQSFIGVSSNSASSLLNAVIRS